MGFRCDATQPPCDRGRKKKKAETGAVPSLRVLGPPRRAVVQRGKKRSGGLAARRSDRATPFFSRHAFCRGGHHAPVWKRKRRGGSSFSSPPPPRPMNKKKQEEGKKRLAGRDLARAPSASSAGIHRTTARQQRDARKPLEKKRRQKTKTTTTTTTRPETRTLTKAPKRQGKWRRRSTF